MKLLVIIIAMMSLAAAPATDQAVRFTTVDVRIDPAGKPLAAYQVEFIADASRVKLVGIEGGDHKAFAPPPYYDPAALSRNRVIVAAFNTGNDLPTKSFRAARLHVQISGSGNTSEKPKWEAKLIVASAADGTAIPAAAASLSEGSEGAAK
jgi:hypothetical protein